MATASRSSRRCREAEMHDFYGVALDNRLMLGTALYPSPAILAEAVRVAGVEVVTVSLRRESAERRDGQAFWALSRELGLRVRPKIGREPSELQSLMRISYAVFCSQKK